MALRAALVLLTVAHWCVAAISDDAEGWCERVCSGTRPTCPPAPPPACPVPVCPPPVVNLTCPEPRCPVPAPCPSCPVPPPCPSCPTCAAPPPSPTPTSLTVPSAASTTPQAAAPFFPYGYLRYSNLGVYKFYPEAMWLEANATCTADGAHLAVPETSPEVDLLLYIMERRNAKKAFIGFHDYYYEGNYRTVLGQPMNSFQHSLWGSGEPDGGVKRNVVYLKSNGHIYDYYNTGTYPFICELPMKPVTSS